MSDDKDDEQQLERDAAIKDLYHKVVRDCNRIIYAAENFGQALSLKITDPTLSEICDILEMAIIPILDKLVDSGKFSPDSGMKAANIKTYSLHLRELCWSIEQDNEAGFRAALAKLKSEAML